MRLLDTTVAVDHLRRVDRATHLIDGFLASREEVVASELTRFELVAGARANELEELEQFFGVLVWIPVDETVARAAGSLADRYGPSHSGIDDVDYLIAATAQVLRAELVTTNVRHFPMLPGLEPAYMIDRK